MRAIVAAVVSLMLVAVLIDAIALAPGLAADPKSPAATDSTGSPAAKTNQTETAVFAGGCFWCTELVFEQLKGVTNVESGYCGGNKNTANYERVHRGTTRHAESIQVTFDPVKISYEQLLDVFFDAHDPTQFNRQGEDEGRQYRSAIFYANDQQKHAAEAKIKELTKANVYRKRIVTTLERMEAFYPAEDYHQDFARANPLLPYLQEHAIPRACTVRINHKELIDPDK
jgi:methionine-S-sulfoxide reductase